VRIEGWDSNRFDQQFEDITMDRLEKAADIIAERANRNCPVGTIVRPVYKTGKYAGRIWTSRNPGRLKKSVRVVRKKTKSGKAFTKKLNVRIYAGHFTAYYPYWVESGYTIKKGPRKKKARKKKMRPIENIEFGTVKIKAQPFLRPAFWGSENDVKRILGVR